VTANRHGSVVGYGGDTRTWPAGSSASGVIRLLAGAACCVLASAVTANGTVRPAARPSSAAASKFACFYVNPTTSLTQTATGNTTLAVTKLDSYIAADEAAPFSQW
jgi:hypothetical protein